MNDCRRFETHLHPLAAGEVDGALALALSVHAASCPDCDGRLRSARRVVARLETAARHPVEPPAGLVRSIMAALPAPRRLSRRAWGLGVAAALAAGFGLLALLAVSLGSGLSFGPQLIELQSLLATVAGRLEQFGAVLETLAGRLPRLPAGLPGGASGGTTLPGLVLVTTGLLGTLAALYLSTLHGFMRTRRS